MQTQSEIIEKDKTRKRPILGAKRERGKRDTERRMRNELISKFSGR